MPMKNPPHPGHSIRDSCLDLLGLNRLVTTPKKPHSPGLEGKPIHHLNSRT
jgi:hypothetical protein